MIFSFRQKFGWRGKIISVFTLLSFVISSLSFPASAVAQSSFAMPAVGTMLHVTPQYAAPVIKGMQVYPDNPLRFDFIVDTGDSDMEGEKLKEVSTKLIKYFLASLTVPEEDLWVNLSPYEEDRIIPENFGYTEMGRDLLTQDYLLKQLTASLMYPEDELGGQFWDTVKQRVKEKYGDIDIPTNTFNKVWIVPDEAEVYVNGDTVFIAKSHLRVMLEEDYLALSENNIARNEVKEVGEIEEVIDDKITSHTSVTSEIIRQIILPHIEQEVNEGKHFAPAPPNLSLYDPLHLVQTQFKQKLFRRSLFRTK